MQICQDPDQRDNWWLTGGASLETRLQAFNGYGKGKSTLLLLNGDPDGDQSFIPLKWLSPFTGEAATKWSFLSEAATR